MDRNMLDKNNWINVNDGQPKFGDAVIVAAQNGKRTAVTWALYDHPRDDQEIGSFLIFLDSRGGYGRAESGGLQVTHWRPLPEHPNGSKIDAAARWRQENYYNLYG